MLLSNHPLGQCNTFGVSFQCSDKQGLSLDLGSFIARVMISTIEFAKHTLDQVLYCASDNSST